jgi:ABC-type uncharacterized transport system ATPase subunit
MEKVEVKEKVKNLMKRLKIDDYGNKMIREASVG